MATLQALTLTNHDVSVNGILVQITKHIKSLVDATLLQ